MQRGCACRAVRLLAHKMELAGIVVDIGGVALTFVAAVRVRLEA